MRLLCEYSDGTTVSLPTAIQRDPYKVRGLVSEAFFHCLAALPDTSAFLRAEHSIRDTLISFDGSDDRYIKPYITSRFLDSRTKTTPRASIIQASFLIGGPLALIGTFHATSNASRNTRNRETLDYLLETGPESHNDLFERARTFPRHASIGPWFQQIINKLDIDTKFLAYFLSALGPHMANVPNVLFTRTRQPSYTFDENGEIVTCQQEIASVLSDESRFNSAIQTLRSLKFLKSSVGIHIDQQLAALISTDPAPWHITAAKVICYIFPKHQSIEPVNYVQDCNSLLPYLQHTFLYPFQGISHLHTNFLFQAIESFLSSLHYSNLDWNLKAILYAENLLSLFKGREQKDFEILTARVAVAKARTMRYSEPVTGSGKDLNITFLCDNYRSRAYSAELAILKAEVQIDLNNYDQALVEISDFEALKSESTLGSFMSDRVKLLRGTVLRFSGHFTGAYAALSSLPHTDTSILQLGAVLCETGECDKAIRHLQLAADPDSSRLACANVHLYKYMQAIKNGRQDTESFRIATSTYLSSPLERSRAKFDITFSILIGRAILCHTQGNIQPARKAWSDALDTLQSCGPSPGYLDVLLSASLSDLSFREHGTETSRLHKDEAKALLLRHPPNYRFVGLGSLWLDILNGKLG
ncbi:hypothetical protein F4678DRAFT_416841 [Xylaria arbuscula]|nr:hypothetical protein F4678DRAFT_416841 [Xylaria arbuscula]